MRLTLHTDYAIRVLVYLACNADRRVSVHEISSHHNISHNHLVKVVNRLSGEGVVLARRGRSGGLLLSRPPHDIIIGDIVRMMETDMLSVVSCQPQNGRPCVLADMCRLRRLLSRSLDAFQRVLDCTTLRDIMPVRL
ncbi:RrF2 family transcriptional regulator [Komagataeibacter swingsii]|uniref:Rrf2 family transcriptional regulator n=1 Tax=Komagataeibacter swingsii TaxID=215220 RepID=A0A850P2A3_9PROT|nr:Rrf2 family transcriptional regulator [Komagataeibacter swingsii]AHI25412.1 transcriptional regulator Rrf2 family [Komagataeibacter xylinus E25]NVN38068.1 Rrf2 family transcriptional regulator [Komagataeibacter swingsii]RFP06423.1 Rrf2 family transcriptional regulator [Komagataeibacter xylinus]RFP07399.1 Rrf2 family transcriptional regulator [Komagataeibacter xylinus]